MKTTLKYTLTALSFAILTSFAFGLSACTSTSGGSPSGTHNMGNLKNPSTMSNQNMPDRR